MFFVSYLKLRSELNVLNVYTSEIVIIKVSDCNLNLKKPIHELSKRSSNISQHNSDSGGIRGERGRGRRPPLYYYKNIPFW